MESIATILSAVRYLGLGFVGLIVVLFVLTLLFGKRKRKKWEFEADFLNEAGREIGEFEVELSKIEKEDDDFVLRSNLRLRHADLNGARAEVFLDGVLVLTVPIETPGRVVSGELPPLVEGLEPHAGQVCAVHVGGREIIAAELRKD